MWKTQALSKEMCLHQRLQAHCHPAIPTYIPPWSCQKLRQRGYATHCCHASWKWSIMVCLPRRTTETRQPARCQRSLLPLLAEAAHSIAMIKHGITVAMKAVEHLNQGQTAVIEFDQPIYGLAKEIP